MVENPEAEYRAELLSQRLDVVNAQRLSMDCRIVQRAVAQIKRRPFF